jgi:3-keto-disaccharide hydrolase
MKYDGPLRTPMAGTRSLVVVLALVSVLSGCTTSKDHTATPTSSTMASGTEFTENFDTVADGERPSGWETHDGQWGARTNLTDPLHPKVMRGAGADPPGLSSLVAPGGAFTNLEAYVKFKMVSGDAGAGLVIHWQDDKNYEIVRYSIRENDWHLFTMVQGNRQKQDTATVGANYTHPDLGEWVILRVTSEDGHVEAFQGSTKVISYDLGSDAAKSGRIGLFVRGDMVADFDDLEAEP